MAYLDLKEEDGFNKALELNGSELGGWNIQVLEGRPRGQNADGNNGRDRFSGPRPGRAFPGRARPGRCPPGRAPPGRDRRAPSKPSVLASAKGLFLISCFLEYFSVICRISSRKRFVLYFCLCRDEDRL